MLQKSSETNPDVFLLRKKKENAVSKVQNDL